jgi:anti-anti-sigma regulatory factor
MTSKALALAESTNIAGVGDLQVALANLLEEADTAGVDVDCSAVRSVDAAVLQCLLFNGRVANAAGKALRIVNPSEDFRRIAGYVGLTDAFAAR